METVILRADAGPDIGTGHVMRSLALAQALAEAGRRPVFAVSECAADIESRLRREGMGVALVAAPAGTPEDAHQTARIVSDTGAAWVVVDGYRFGPGYHRVVGSTGARRLAIDDRGDAATCDADLVLNQNLHADVALYSAGRAARQLLGPRYALLRREFRVRCEGLRPVARQARRLLVTFGGSDPTGMTERVLDAIGVLGEGEVEATVVVGASNPRAGALAERCRRMRPGARIVHNATDMPDLMHWADAAICSGGSTVWELAYMGVPALVGATVPVEELLVRGLVARGLFTEIASFSTATPGDVACAIESLLRDEARRTAMRELGRTVVDGQGAMRVVAAMSEQEGGHGHS